MRKIYLVPNFVTTANLFCGFYSIIASIQSDFTVAAWAIVAASIFDLLDGRIARLAKATSEFGSEYDSMSDLVSFGLAPAILQYQWSLYPFGRLGWMVCFIFIACGALRLARFNVNVDVVPKGHFQGLPIPMAAGILSTLVIFSYATGWMDEARSGYVILVLSLLLSGLMVSTMPFPSFKELNWRSRSSFGFLLTGVIVMVLIAIRPEVTLFLTLIAYLFFSFGVLIFKSLFKGKARKEVHHEF
jgi:CDP-diacylglycerol--serine O-phosphatidyltransferase